MKMGALKEIFWELGKDKACQQTFSGYFNLPPWGLDIQRSYELMTLIDEDVLAAQTNKDNEKIPMVINEHIINNALKFK